MPVKSFPLTIGKIPRGRTVVISDGNGDILSGVPLFFEGEISIKASSKFGPIWDFQANNLMSLISSSFSTADMTLPSGQFAIQGAQIWQSTEPLSLDLEVKLYMNKSGLTDVVKPTLALVETCLPTKKTMGDGTQVGDINFRLSTLLPPGPNLQALINSSGSVTVKEGSALSKGIKKGAKGTYNIVISNYLSFKDVIITEVQPTFSKVLDEDGFPIASTLSLSIQTMNVATTDMIEDVIKSLTK